MGSQAGDIVGGFCFPSELFYIFFIFTSGYMFHFYHEAEKVFLKERGKTLAVDKILCLSIVTSSGKPSFSGGRE